MEIPVIDVSALRTSGAECAAAGIRGACREHGFFYVVGHGVDPSLVERLDRLSRHFFALPEERKLAIRMSLGGRAWRGYFPVGGELTSGRPDQKQGLYFGAELGPGHPKVRDGTPLHGPNLFPDLPGFRETLLAYLEAMTELGHLLMEGIARSLDLDASYFATRYTGDPLVLFRVFHYPALSHSTDLWSVGEHTDYGLLTILHQDDAGGLEVKTRAGWTQAPPVPGSFVCNIGDMLDRMTAGLYRSTPHRVRNQSGQDRVSLAFFFDPGFDAMVAPIRPGAAVEDDHEERWDRASVHEFEGSYGDYLLAKVSKVFPELGRGVL